MAAIDTVLGLDWSEATYIGDGVYLMDATHPGRRSGRGAHRPGVPEPRHRL